MRLMAVLLTMPTQANGYSDELKFERTQYALTHTGRFDLGTLDSAITYNTTETFGRTIPGTDWHRLPIGDSLKTLRLVVINAP